MVRNKMAEIPDEIKKTSLVSIFGAMLAEDICYDEIMRWGRYHFGPAAEWEEFKTIARGEAKQFAKEYAEKYGCDYEEGTANDASKIHQGL